MHDHYSPHGQMHCEVRCRAGTGVMVGWIPGEEYQRCREGTAMIGWSPWEEYRGCRAGTECEGGVLGWELQI